MCSARKLIMFALLAALVTSVSGDCEDKCHCSKYKVFCSLARLGALPTRIAKTTELVKVELDNIQKFNSSSGLQNITHLQLVNVNLREIAPGAFKNASRLEYLAITHNNITNLETDTFKYLHYLYFLNLSHNEIKQLSRGAFSRLPNLKILDLNDNHIKKLDANMFVGMRCNEISTSEYENFFAESVIEPAAFKYLSALSRFQISPSTPNRIPTQIPFGVRISTNGYFEYVNRNNEFVISELLYLDRSHYLIKPNDMKFHNFTKLTYLDISLNSFPEINSGYFEGLLSLKKLIMKNNVIPHLNNGTFYGLQSLEMLDISYCGISTIESRAFEGLSKLRTLDLSWNIFDTLNNSTFSSLRMLKELMLDGNIIAHIDSGSFSDLTNLKSMFNNFFKISYLTAIRDIEHLEPLNTVSETAFVQLQRLDNLHLFVHITIPKEIQVLNALHLYIHAGYDDPHKKLHDALQTVRYVRSLSANLLQVKSIEFLATFYEFHISELMVSFTDFVFLNSENLYSLSTLKSLTLYGIFDSAIEEGAFCAMRELKELRMYYNSKFPVTNGLFLGLKNLKLLSIKCHIYEFPSTDSGKIEENAKYLDRGFLVGMDNLKRLLLRDNYFERLKPGAFEGLNKIEEIDLSENKIEKIEAGVFGAICKDDFEISCKNVTLPEYCNNTNALKTLKYLYLYHNSISHIHPHAFVSCTNLETLSLSSNTFLTLDIPFLYTPGLRKLNMFGCSITKVPNETFACTPLLSEIDFQNNYRMSELTVSALLPLRQLKNIYLRKSGLRCGCDIYQTWMWMRQNRVNYDLFCKNLGSIYYYYVKEVETELLNMICNSTVTNIPVPINRTTDTNDFAFFKQYVEPIVLIIILTFGLLSNGFLLFIALLYSDMRTKQNACIIHLSTVELLSLVLNLPLSYWDAVNIRWEFDDSLCIIFIFSKDVGVAVTAFSTVALSLERFLVARTFQNFKKICKSETQPTAWLVFMTWISGIVCSLPAYFSAGVFQGKCLYCPPGNQIYMRNVWTFQLVMYCLLPSFAIIFLNVKTSVFLRASIRKIPGEMKDNDRVKNRRKVANISLILVLVFIVSYLPNYILRFLVAWSFVDMEDLFLPSFFTFCLFFFNTVFNPISIFIMSSKFKSYALRYLPFLENFLQHSRPEPRILNAEVRRPKEFLSNIVG